VCPLANSAKPELSIFFFSFLFKSFILKNVIIFQKLSVKRFRSTVLQFTIRWCTILKVNHEHDIAMACHLQTSKVMINSTSAKPVTEYNWNELFSAWCKVFRKICIWDCGCDNFIPKLENFHGSWFLRNPFNCFLLAIPECFEIFVVYHWLERFFHLHLFNTFFVLLINRVENAYRILCLIT